MNGCKHAVLMGPFLAAGWHAAFFRAALSILRVRHKVYAAIYIWKYAHMYICMPACMHVCLHICLHVCLYACMNVCMYAVLSASGTP